MNKKHPFPPVFDYNSKILILGTMPSIKSTELGFYYMHPTNRFWKVLGEIVDNNFFKRDINIKKKLLIENKIALYDIIENCDIKASSDSSIKNVIVQDINVMIKNSNIKAIFLNGKKAYEIFIKKYENLKNIAVCLPSTSAANAAYSIEDLIEKWMGITKFL